MSKQADDLFDDEVTTGATLDSGTTVGGNQVFHLGNDGEGSGLDVETVDGQEPVTKGEKYKIVDIIDSVSVIDKYQPQDKLSTNITGITGTSDGCLWVSERTNGSVFQIDGNASIISKFSTEDRAEDISSDSNDSLWVAISFNEVYQYSRSGNNISNFQSPCSSKGIGVDNNDSVWIVSNSFDSIQRLNQSGTVISGFSEFNPGQIGIQSNNSIWVSDNAGFEVLDINGNLKNDISANFSFGGPEIKENIVWSTGGDFDDKSIFKLDKVIDAVSLSEI